MPVALQFGVMVPAHTAHVPLFPHASGEFPDWHVVPSQHPVLQGTHAPPVLPHAVVVFPGRHVPVVRSQHPVAQRALSEQGVQVLLEQTGFGLAQAAQALPPLPQKPFEFPE